MYNASAFYQHCLTKEKLNLYLDIDLKRQLIVDFSFSGELATHYQAELEEIKTKVINQTLTYAKSISRLVLNDERILENETKALTSLGLWLLQEAIDDYLGANVTLEATRDVLCLCFGVSKKDIKTKILARSDYDLPHLIAETMATSACGSCRLHIVKEMQEVREKNGKILGLQHSQSRVGADGRWIKIKGNYPAKLIILLDELKNEWMIRENLNAHYEIEFVNIEGFHLWLSVKANKDEGQDSNRFQKILDALAEYLHSKFGVLFFLHLAF